MQCPTDATTLVMSERSGIEIDYCPQCRGVWLDRGELDKIIERSGPAQQAQPAPEPYREQRPPQDSYRQGYQGHQGHGYPHKRRKSFLEELFD